MIDDYSVEQAQENYNRAMIAQEQNIGNSQDTPIDRQPSEEQSGYKIIDKPMSVERLEDQKSLIDKELDVALERQKSLNELYKNPNATDGDKQLIQSQIQEEERKISMLQEESAKIKNAMTEYQENFNHNVKQTSEKIKSFSESDDVTAGSDIDTPIDRQHSEEQSGYKIIDKPMSVERLEDQKSQIDKELDAALERQKSLNELYKNPNATDGDKQLIQSQIQEEERKISMLQEESAKIKNAMTEYQENFNHNVKQTSEKIKSFSESDDVTAGSGIDTPIEGSFSSDSDISSRISEFLSNNSNVTEEEVSNFIREYYPDGILNSDIDDVFSKLDRAAKLKNNYPEYQFDLIAGMVGAYDDSVVNGASTDTDIENAVELPDIKSYGNRIGMFYKADYSKPDERNIYQRVGEIVTGETGEGSYSLLEKKFKSLHENMSAKDKEELLNTDWNAKTEAMIADANLIIQELEEYLSASEDFGGELGEILKANVNLSLDDLILLKDYLKDNLENVAYYAKELGNNIKKADELNKLIKLKNGEIEKKTDERNKAQEKVNNLKSNPRYNTIITYYNSRREIVSSAVEGGSSTSEQVVDPSWKEELDAAEKNLDEITEQLSKLEKELDQLKEDLNTVEDAGIECIKYIELYDAVRTALSGYMKNVV